MALRRTSAIWLVASLLVVALAMTSFLHTSSVGSSEQSNDSPTLSSLPRELVQHQLHTDIITTVFWVGEPSDSDNGYIPNQSSAWDEVWQQHYGGIDAQQPRSGYMPQAFQPKENSFYIALPYNDLAEEGSRKASASACLTVTPTPQPDNHSWCKNSWIAITAHGKTAYAQWEDVGPFNEDNIGYVFGNQAPANSQGEHAGLDVSPAVSDYLGLGDVSNTNWRFVKASDVPTGPWRARITESLGYTID